MLPVIAALSVAFVVLHFVPSHPPVRDALVARLGTGTYLLAYSALHLGIFVPLVYLWFTHRLDDPLLWVVRDPATTGVLQIFMLVGTGLVGAGVLDAPPTSITTHHGRLSGTDTTVRGIAAVTRHPLSTGIALVAAGHVVVNGWPADLWFWGGMLVLSVFGALHQDFRQGREPRFAEFQAQTSVLPNPLGVQRMGARTWAGVVLGVAGGLALRFAHPWFV